MSKQGKISIQFLGAAGTVTGSKHLLKTPEGNFLVDCGLFQGLKSLRIRNRTPLPVDVRQIQCVLLTHAHLDHCGYLPLLGKLGFSGKIYCTPPTRELTEIILRDSAKIQEEDAAYANKRGFSRHAPAEPLYTERDVERILPKMVTSGNGEQVSLSDSVQATFRRNGHILGSAFLDLNCFGKRLVFSGDLGRPVSALLAAPDDIPAADYLVMESTYGDKLHPVAIASDEIADAIIDTVRKGGDLLIPSFAVGRAQELMHLINELKRVNRIPNVPVFMDSPMGANATAVFRRHADWHKLSAEQCNSIFENVTIISDFSDTMKVASTSGTKIVIAASGMLTGGRALFYLEKYIESSKNTILFAGYQSEGTRGRSLLDGAHELKMHGAYYKVKANMRSLGSMSGHADQKEMLDWLAKPGMAPERMFLVHGENGPREAFRLKIETTMKWKVASPEWLEEVELFAT